MVSINLQIIQNNPKSWGFIYFINFLWMFLFYNRKNMLDTCLFFWTQANRRMFYLTTDAFTKCFIYLPAMLTIYRKNRNCFSMQIFFQESLFLLNMILKEKNIFKELFLYFLKNAMWGALQLVQSWFDEGLINTSWPQLLTIFLPKKSFILLYYQLFFNCI